MHYHEIAPTGEISHLVLSFWEFVVKNDAPAPIEHEIFPDGCISMFYHRNDNLNIRRLALSGLFRETVKVPVVAGDVFRGVRFSPAACARILRRNPADFQTKNVFEAEEFSHLTGNLLEKLEACRDFSETIAVYENRLKELNRADYSDEKIARAIQFIEEAKGEIKIADLARAVNLSVRQFERRFKQNSGLTPKQYARARRIRATAISLLANETWNLANHAAEMGFTDQSHLTHEFVAVTGRAPNSFAEKVKKIEHGNLV